MQIALAARAQILDAAVAEAEGSPALGSGRNFDGRFSLKGGDFELSPLSGGHKRQGHRAEKVISLPLKNVMLPDVEKHIEVSRLPPPEAGIAVATGAQAGAVIDTCGNIDFDTCRLIFAALAPASREGIGDGLPGTVASGALRLLDKDTVLTSDNSLAPASAAGFAAATAFRATAVTSGASFQLFDLKLFLDAGSCLLE